MEQHAHVQLTTDDVVALWRYDRKHNRAQRQATTNTLVTWCLIIVMMAVVPAYMSKQAITGAHYLIAGCGIAYLFWANLGVTRWAGHGSGRRQMNAYCVTISSEGLGWESELQRTFLNWRLVSDIDADEQRLYFMLDDNAGAVVVPRGAFPDDAAFDSFAGAARAHWLKVPGSQSVCPRCGFDLRGAIVGGCPECGWRREETRPS